MTIYRLPRPFFRYFCYGTSTQPIIGHTSRFGWGSGVRNLLPLLLVGLAITPSLADDEQRETTITRLEFRVVDVEPDAQPVRAFRYSLALYSTDQEEPHRGTDIAYRSENGVLRIPKPFPPFGRIRVWVDADDLEKGYRHGYGSFSYRIDTNKLSEPTTIQLEPGIVLTGKVLEAQTDKPIAGAEVAPLKWGHHFAWADWDESAKTDQEGSYRVITRSAKGIAARHPDYRGIEVENDSRQFTLHLCPLMTLAGRVVDSDGKPVAGVSATWCEDETDAEGRFCLKVTRDEWEQREKQEISFYALNHRSLDVPLKSFSFDQETVVTLEPEPLIRGQIFDENGNPLEHCKIELKRESENVGSDFYTIPGPHKEGKWEEHITKYHQVFTLRVSVAGSVRSLRQYSREEATDGPIITRLAEGHRLTGRLVAQVPLDEKNTPVVLLDNAANEDLRRRARVQADGTFAFFGLADGQYTLRLHPAISSICRGGHMNAGVGAFTTFGFASPNKPWERSITIEGAELQLDPINLHDAGVLPGCVTGVAHNPDVEHKPFDNAFGYICAGEDDFDTVGGSYYLLRFMTDAEGRFRIDACPPGKYVLRLTGSAGGYGPHDPSVWIRVTPEKTIDLRLFSPESDHQLAINFVVGDGSSRDVHAGAALDAAVIAKHVDPKTGKRSNIKDAEGRLRVQPSYILCQLEPLDETATHWPIYTKRFEFSPRELLEENPRDIVIPNVPPGRWRLTLTATYIAAFCSSETLLTRNFEVSKRMAPLEIEMLPSALSGTFDNPAAGPWDRATVEAIPQQPGRPTRTCYGEASFRFIGLAPGKYSLRVQAQGCETKHIDDVIIQRGQATWLDKFALKRGPEPGPASGHSKLDP
ncbi:MAG: carboxypeptidase regulatory-like domain-containing protein [Planctomycetes bacterium]|nr:carboxypeptidase regulatory-like domain-containing protein [Planctomycetota bacterium]MBL7040931.1 carboxypeptidase regulatory-like domain-containing protein [Pirellulaceae bacterium]